MQAWKANFRYLSDHAVAWAGRPKVLAGLILVIMIWLAAGVYFSFPTQWFLLTNLVGTLVVFLVMLIMQHSQNADMMALHAKLDELIRSSEAGNHWIAAEQRPPIVIDEMRAHQHRIANDHAATSL